MSGAVTHNPIDAFIDRLGDGASPRAFRALRWIVGAKPKTQSDDRADAAIARATIAPDRAKEYLSDIW